MKTKLKTISDTKVELTVTLDASDLAPFETKATASLAAKLKLPGFRSGKVPTDVAIKHLSPNDIASTALDLAVRNTVIRAFDEVKKTPLIMPEVEVKKFVPSQSVEYTATAEVLPEIKLGNFAKLGVKPAKNQVSDKDIEDVLSNIANAYAEKIAVKRAAKLGDEAILDFTGKKDDVAFAGGSAKNHALLLGSGQFIPGFEDGIVGHQPGDKFDLELTFPKNYHNADLAGAKTVFEVLLKQVNQVNLPAYDDQFAAKCGPFKTMDDLKKDIKINLEHQNQHKIDEDFKDQLVAKLVEVSTVSAPEILISDQLEIIKNDLEQNAKASNLSLEEYLKANGSDLKKWEKSAKAVAKQRVEASLVLQILAREQNITVSDEVVAAKIAELKEVYQKSPEALKNLETERVRQDIKNRLTIEKTLDFLAESNQPAKK